MFIGLAKIGAGSGGGMGISLVVVVRLAPEEAGMRPSAIVADVIVWAWLLGAGEGLVIIGKTVCYGVVLFVRAVFGVARKGWFCAGGW